MIGSHWAPTSQLTLGSFTGLRGYNSYEFEGQRMLVVNLEHRMFSLLKVWFFKLGTSYFFDSGVLWNEGEGFGGQKFHSSAGVGIQIESGMSAWPSLAFLSASARSQKSTNSRWAIFRGSLAIFRRNQREEIGRVMPEPRRST
jgi:hemolysin activation/secretion protein